MKWSEPLAAYLQDRARQDLFSGVVLITQGGEELFTGAYGYASRAWQIPNTLETRFDTASVTKLFTAIALLQQIEQGRLAFDTRALDFLGLESPTISRDVTVFNLLTHTSGIGDDCDEEAGEVYEELWKTKANYSVTETAHFLPQFISKPANFPPGQGCRYCNCSFILLGLMLEKVAGMTYRDYVQRFIFERAGMHSSGFFRLDRVHENLAEGSDPLRDEAGQISGWKRNIYSFPPVGSPDSGAYVTARDLARCLRCVQAGELISPEMVRSLTTPQVFYRETQAGRWMFSYVLEFLLDPDGQVVFYQKDGVNAGVSALLRYYPARDVTVVLLSNMEAGVWEPARAVHEWVLGGVD